MSRRINILRLIRLQLKSGYLKREPDVYDALKAAPSLSFKQSEEFVKTRVPYAGLLEKAYARNPVLQDETIFPAYGNLEPRALILAKKQYFYMQQGMTEDAAYEKALEFVEELEAHAYDDMSEVVNELKKMRGKAPIYSVPQIAEEIAWWREILKTKPYDGLTQAEQGELDKFVQTQILQWTEVERERRMKDFVFHHKYVKLIEALFPSNEEAIETQRKDQIDFSRQFLKLHGYSLERLETTNPFLIEDYFKFFEAAKSAEKWSEDETETFDNWILNTLVFKTAAHVEGVSYVEDTIDQFFPVLALPSRVAHLKLPSIDQVRSLLYTNKIGYKVMNDKIFVKRFYMLPRLLFPIDSFCAKMVRDEVLFFKVTSVRDILLEEMKKFGLPESDFEEVSAILRENYDYVEEKFNSKRAKKQTEDEEDKKNRLTMLDDLIDLDGDEDEEIIEEEVKLNPEESALMEKLVDHPELIDFIERSDLSEEQLLDLLTSMNILDHSSAAKLLSSVEATEDEDEDDNDNWLFGEEEEEEDEDVVREVDRYGPGVTKGAAEWPTVFDKYIKKPTSALARDREKLYRWHEEVDETPEHLSTERDLKEYMEARSEMEIIMRAKLAVEYEKKEAARREVEESQRNLMREKDFPLFLAPVTSNHSR